MNYMKCMSGVFALLISVSAFAQMRENPLRRISDETNQMVQSQADSLDRDSRRQIIELLRQVQTVIRNNSQGSGSIGQVDRQNVGPVSRRTGGTLMGATLNRQGVLRSLQIRSMGSFVKIYQVSAVLRNGQRVSLNSGSLNQQLGQNATALFDVSPAVDAAVAIEVVAEAWADGIYLEINTVTQNGDMGGGPLHPPQPAPQPQPPQVNGYYCMAACKNSAGSANLMNSAGARAGFRTEAEAASIAALRQSYSCSYGAVIVECSPEYQGAQVTSLAACVKSDGKINLMNSGNVGVGSSETEAKTKAISNLRNSYSCSYGAAIYGTSSESRPAYCLAACATSSGEANLNTAQGASGNSVIEATAAALSSLRQSYSCSYGAVIQNCETR